MKRPLVPVALCYGGGLLLADFWQPLPAALFAGGFAVLALALARPRFRAVLLYPLLVLAGWTNLTWRTAVLAPDDLRSVLANAPAYVTVRGTLRETPSLRVFRHDEQETGRTLVQLDVHELHLDSAWRHVTGRIVITTLHVTTNEFFAGQRVEVSGALAPPPSPVADGLFDYRQYLARQGIYFQLKADSTNAWRLVGGSHPSRNLSDRFLEWSQRTLARGLPARPHDQPLRLMWAMTLGWRTALTGEVSEPFMRSGTMHIFAISGLHIALIAGILVALLRVMQVSRIWCGLVVIPLIWFYTLVTGWQPSAIRSTVMMTIIIGGWALKRPTDLINSLAAAAFIILLWDPQQLFQASFQLSFFVVLSIALLLPPLQRVGERWLQPDPLLPRALIPRWQRWLATPLRYLMTSLATSLAAWLGSLPLTAFYFHLFSPVTLLANLVVVPLSSAALACNLGSLICGGWLPWATELFNHSGWFWMLAMMKASHWATLPPGASWYVRAPSLSEFVIYYALLVGMLSGWLFGARRRRWAAGVVVLVAGVYGWNWQQSRGTFEITALPLNGAHSVFVRETGKDGDWLVDCGNTNSVEFTLKPFLRSKGVNHVPRLVLTHGDLRHVGGFETLEEIFGVGEVFASPVRFRSQAYRRIAAELLANPSRGRTIQRGNRVGGWQVLHPDASDRFPQGDDNALVLMGTFYQTRVLLLSDLGRPGQETLLKRGDDLRADIVIAGLPEQGEPLSDGLLAAIQPQVVVIADSEFPATKRASQGLKDRLAQHGAAVIYTRTAGAVTLTVSKSGWELHAMNGIRFSSRDERPRQLNSAVGVPVEAPASPDESPVIPMDQ